MLTLVTDSCARIHITRVTLIILNAGVQTTIVNCVLTLPGILVGLHAAYTYWQGYLLYGHIDWVCVQIDRVTCCL